MNRLQKQVADFMEKAGQECPSKPTAPSTDTRILRVRLLLEEVLEFAKASGVEISIPYVSSNKGEHLEFNKEDSDNVEFQMWTVILSDLEGVDFTLQVDAPNLLEVADALTDINYVSYGAANAYGIDLEPFEHEVHANNMSKFEDGFRDPDTGKWQKGPSYKPVDLLPILKEQMEL